MTINPIETRVYDGDYGGGQLLAPDIHLADPEDPRDRVLVLRQPQGVRVDEYNAMSLGAVFACVRVIAETIAGLPWQEFKQVGTSRVRLENETVDWLLDTQANPETPAFQFRETLLAHALTWGNGYAEIERDGAGRPVWLWQITPDRVRVERDGNGRIVYVVNNGHGKEPTFLPAEDVFHLRGLGFDGLVGYSVIAFAARSIGVGISTDTAAGSFFENDSTPGGLLKHPGRVSPEAANRLRKSWSEKHQGAANRRRVAILEEGMDWTETGIPPRDAQLVENRQATPAEICRWFRVPPHKIADLSRATFSNIEQESISFVSDSLMPWVRRLETEADIKLFGRTNRGRVYTRINVNGLLRGDAASRGAFYQLLLDRGVLSINDVLSLEDRNEIGTDGDKRFVPLNMQLLEDAGEEPPPAPAPIPGEVPPDDDEPELEPQTEFKAEGLGKNLSEIVARETAEKPAPGKLAHLRPITLDVCQQIARREKARGLKAATMDVEQLSKVVSEFLTEHEAYCVIRLRPIISALAAVTQTPLDIAEKVLFVTASLHRDKLAAQLPATWGDDSDLTPDSLFVPFSKGVYGS